MLGLTLCLCGPEHTLRGFQLQRFFGKFLLKLLYGATQRPQNIFLEEGGLFVARFKTTLKGSPVHRKAGFFMDFSKKQVPMCFWNRFHWLRAMDWLCCPLCVLCVCFLCSLLRSVAICALCGCPLCFQNLRKTL